MEDISHVVIAVVAVCAGVFLSRRIGLSRTAVVEALLVTVAGCLILCAPVSAAIQSLSAPGLVDDIGVFGHSSLVPALVASCILPPYWLIRRREKCAEVLLLAVMVGSLGYALVKLACFEYGCCFGTRTFGWHAVQFGSNSPAALALGRKHYVHPVQLYESAAASIVFCVLVWQARKRDALALACLGSGALAAARFILERFRAEYDLFNGDHRLIGGISGLTENSTLCTLALVLTCTTWLLFKKDRGVGTSCIRSRAASCVREHAGRQDS